MATLHLLALCALCLSNLILPANPLLAVQKVRSLRKMARSKTGGGGNAYQPLTTPSASQSHSSMRQDQQQQEGLFSPDPSADNHAEAESDAGGNYSRPFRRERDPSPNVSHSNIVQPGRGTATATATMHTFSTTHSQQPVAVIVDRGSWQPIRTVLLLRRRTAFIRRSTAVLAVWLKNGASPSAATPLLSAPRVMDMIRTRTIGCTRTNRTPESGCWEARFVDFGEGNFERGYASADFGMLVDVVFGISGDH